MKRALLPLVPVLLLAACSDSESSSPATTAPAATTGATTGATDGGTDIVTFTAEVWADNWFSLYVNGELVGEDGSITERRSKA